MPSLLRQPPWRRRPLLRQLRLGRQLPAPAPVGPETTISGPQTAKVGQEFKITGKTDKGLKGSKVYAYQDGKKIAAERTVAANGDISMRIVSGKAGANQAYQFRVVDGAKNVWRSNTIHINVVK